MRPSRSASSHSAGPHPVIASSRGVAFVKDQIDHFQHRRQPHDQFGAAGNFKRHSLFRQGAFGANDALGDGRLGDQEGARDLVGRQTSEQAKRERHPRLGGEDRMAGDEDQAEQIVANVIIQSAARFPHLKLARAHLSGVQFTAKLFVLALQPRVSAEIIDGAMLGRGHQPGARIVRHARLRPLLERGHQSILRQVLRNADVAHDAGKPGDQSRGLDPPDRINGTMCIG